MKNRHRIALVCDVLLAIGLASGAAGQTDPSSSSYRLTQSALSAGGGTAVSESFTAAVNLGEPAASLDASSPSFAVDTGYFSLPIEVEIDVAPGDEVNTINLGNRNGRVAVAIRATPAFAVDAVDTATDASGKAKITLSGAPAEVRKGQVRSEREDVDQDGDEDLLVFFPSSAIDPDRLSRREGRTYAMLVAVTRSGTPLSGRDGVRVVF